MPFEVRPASASDLAQLTDIYNHYILHTPVTFDLQPFTAEQRLPWYEAHAGGGAHRLVVAEDRGTLVGYASTSLFRVKPAYATTVEASVYVRPEAVGRGVGRALYAKLFEDVAERRSGEADGHPRPAQLDGAAVADAAAQRHVGVRLSGGDAGEALIFHPQAPALAPDRHLPAVALDLIHVREMVAVLPLPTSDAQSGS